MRRNRDRVGDKSFGLGARACAGSLPARATEVTSISVPTSTSCATATSNVKAASSVGPLERDEWKAELAGQERDLNFAKDKQRQYTGNSALMV